MATSNDAKAKLAAEMAKKPKPGKGSITDQVTSKYGKDYGKVTPGSKKWIQMGNDSRFN